MSERPGFHSARVNKGHPRRQARRDRAAERLLEKVSSRESVARLDYPVSPEVAYAGEFASPGRSDAHRASTSGDEPDYPGVSHA